MSKRMKVLIKSDEHTQMAFKLTDEYIRDNNLNPNKLFVTSNDYNCKINTSKLPQHVPTPDKPNGIYTYKLGRIYNKFNTYEERVREFERIYNPTITKKMFYILTITCPKSAIITKSNMPTICKLFADKVNKEDHLNITIAPTNDIKVVLREFYKFGKISVASLEDKFKAREWVRRFLVEQGYYAIDGSVYGGTDADSATYAEMLFLTEDAFKKVNHGFIV